MTTTTASANVVSKFSKCFRVKVGIYDAKTQVRIGSVECPFVCRGALTAEHLALCEAESYALWEIAMPSWCKKYLLTEFQFLELNTDGKIRPLESYTFKVEKTEILSSNPIKSKIL